MLATEWRNSNSFGKKITYGLAVRPHDPVHPILHHHGHAHAGDAAMLRQEPRWHEAGFCMQVPHDHWLPFANRKTRLRMSASLHRQGSDETFAPADTGDEIQVFIRFTRNEDFAEFHIQSLCRQAHGFVHDLLHQRSAHGERADPRKD